MKFLISTNAPSPRLTGLRSLLFACALWGACSSSADDGDTGGTGGTGGAGVQADASPSASAIIDVAAWDLLANAAFHVFSIALSSGELLANFEGTSLFKLWVSNPIFDSNGRLWFAQNSDLYSVADPLGSGTQVEPTLSVEGSSSQEALLFPSAGGDDLLVWAPSSGIYRVALGVALPTSTLGFQSYADGETFLEAARVGDSLWICANEGVVEVALATEPRLVFKPKDSCSVATLGDEAFIADELGIYRIAIN